MAFQQMLKNLGDMLGQGFWRHVIFLITHLKINMYDPDDDSKDEKKDTDDDDSSEDEDFVSAEQFIVDFKGLIRGKLSLKSTPKAFGVENMNKYSYNAAIKYLIDNMPNEKLDHKLLVSPFDVDKVNIHFPQFYVKIDQ